MRSETGISYIKGDLKFFDIFFHLKITYKVFSYHLAQQPEDDYFPFVSNEEERNWQKNKSRNEEKCFFSVKAEREFARRIGSCLSVFLFNAVLGRAVESAYLNPLLNRTY